MSSLERTNEDDARETARLESAIAKCEAEQAKLQAEVDRLLRAGVDRQVMEQRELLIDPAGAQLRRLRQVSEWIPRPMLLIPGDPELSFWIEKGREPVTLQGFTRAQLLLEIATSPEGVAVGSHELRHVWRELSPALPHVFDDKRGGQRRRARMRESMVPLVWCDAPALLELARKADARARSLL